MWLFAKGIINAGSYFSRAGVVHRVKVCRLISLETKRLSYFVDWGRVKLSGSNAGNNQLFDMQAYQPLLLYT